MASVISVVSPGLPALSLKELIFLVTETFATRPSLSFTGLFCFSLFSFGVLLGKKPYRHIRQKGQALYEQGEV